MIIDEFGEVIPVPYMVSNHETGLVLEAVYESIKSKVGTLEPMVFMTDDAPYYFSPWQKVLNFGKSLITKKILCQWHNIIDKTWRRAIKEKIKDKEFQFEVYHHLMVLLQESTHIEFNKKLQQFLTFLTDCGLNEF